jgi:hypothetical protein
MRILVCTALATALAACSSIPVSAPMVTQGSQKDNGFNLKLPAGNYYHCIGDAVTNPLHYPNCRDDPIPLVILWDSSGKCQALPPYHELVIHTGGQKTVVKWKIQGPAEYVFVTTGDGVSLKDNASGPKVTDVYEGKQRDNPQTFRISVKQIAPGSSLDGQIFSHAPAVVDPVNPNSTCFPVDPLITNRSN